MARLDGKVAIVTGAGSGLGEAIATLYASEGARVLIAEIDAERGQAVCDAIAQAGGTSLFARTDVANEGDVAGMVEAAATRWGGVDVLVNNAGIAPEEGEMHELPAERFDQILGVNLRGVFLGIKYAVPRMVARGGGSIISTASIGAIVGFRGGTAYSAAKGGIVGLTLVAAVEYADRGIRANAILPGVIATPLALHGPRSGQDPVDEKLARLARLQPIPRAGQPVDIANAALWLASDESSFVTGQQIVVDGGYVIEARRG